MSAAQVIPDATTTSPNTSGVFGQTNSSTSRLTTPLPQPSQPTKVSVKRDTVAANLAAAGTTRANKRAYVRLLVGVDLAVVAIAAWGGYLARFQGSAPGTNIPYVPVGLALIGLWILVLARTRCYDDRVLGYGADEYRRVVGASLQLAGGVAIVGYIADVGSLPGLPRPSRSWPAPACCRRGATSPASGCTARAPRAAAGRAGSWSSATPRT